MAAPLVRDGRLVEVLADRAAAAPAVFALVLPGRRRAPKIRAFVDFVSDALGSG